MPVGAPPSVRTARAARPMRITPIAPGVGAPTTELAGSYARRSTAPGANRARSAPNADYPQSHPGRVLLHRSLQVAVPVGAPPRCERRAQHARDQFPPIGLPVTGWPFMVASLSTI